MTYCLTYSTTTIPLMVGTSSVTDASSSALFATSTCDSASSSTTNALIISPQLDLMIVLFCAFFGAWFAKNIMHI